MITRRRGTSRSAISWLALCICLTCSGCKEGEDFAGLGGSNLRRIDPDFAPETGSGTVTSDLVTLQIGSVTDNKITLDVVVTNVATPISGIAIRLSYPRGIATFLRCADGDLFQPGSCQAAESPAGSGKVVVSRSLVAPEPPVGATGSVVIVRLQFAMIAVGTGPIVFEAQNLGGGNATALLDANGNPILVAWFEGELIGS